jgi:uncharacterized protein (DUF362 family)
MMGACSRRTFLVNSAVGLSAAAGGRLLALDAADQAKPADMAIARWKGEGVPAGKQLADLAANLTEKAISGLGGLGRFVGKGSVVWVKPNIGWDRTPETAANCNPDVVATVVRLCFDAGAKKVKVGDNPCDLPAQSYASSGIAAAVRPLGAEVVMLDRSRFRNTAIGGEKVKTLPMYPEILDCDLVINIAVVKHHRLANATLCMKNYMGVMENRRTFHQDIGTCVADLTRFMKPRIAILDAVRVLKANGPKGGNLADVALKTTVAAGVDLVALDALGAELLGRKPTDIPTIVKGQEVGLGKMDYRSLALREIAVV